MFGKPERPTRPYKNLEDFRQNVTYNSSRFPPGIYPCLKCKGGGTIYDPDDPPCPVEGNKMRNRIACPSCDRSGVTTKAVHQEAYKSIIDKWKKEVKEFDLIKSIYDSVIRKLTKEEIKALKYFGI